MYRINYNQFESRLPAGFTAAIKHKFAKRPELGRQILVRYQHKLVAFTDEQTDSTQHIEFLTFNPLMRALIADAVAFATYRIHFE